MTAFGETHIAIHYKGWILLHVSYTLKHGEKALGGSGGSTIPRWNRAYEKTDEELAKYPGWAEEEKSSARKIWISSGDVSHPHCRAGETEDQTGQATCPKSHRQKEAEP